MEGHKFRGGMRDLEGAVKWDRGVWKPEPSKLREKNRGHNSLHGAKVI